MKKLIVAYHNYSKVPETPNPNKQF